MRSNEFSKKIMIILVSFIFLFAACNDDTADLATVQRTIDEINVDWRYYGFSFYFEEYKPDIDLLDSIKENFDPSIHKLLLYTSPSCFSCGQMDSLLPFVAKIIKSAQLSDTSYFLFDTPNIQASHPFDTLIILKSIPSVFTLSGGTIFSVLDTFLHQQEESENVRLEEILIEALR